MEIDCVVISRKKYDLFMRYDEVASKLEKDAIEYLKFPKLEP